MKQVRYGMVGGDIHAFIGEVHRKAINFDTRAELVAGCFSNIPEYNVETARAYSIDKTRVYDDYKQMAKKESEREDGIDFVTIAVPNFLHYEVAKEFIIHGINVVCEKPLCFDIEQAVELERLVKEHNVVFAIPYTYTGYAMSKVIREMIRGGKIGEIISINAEYAQDWLLNDLTPKEGEDLNLSVWRKNPKVSGISNCVGDIGTHIENYIHFATGMKIRRLCATTNCYGQELDLNANILVEYENGVNGAYWCSQIAAGRLNGLVVRIYGKLGSVEWEQQYPDYVRYTPLGKATQLLSRGNSYIKENASTYSRIPTGHPEGLYVAFANIYKNFITAVIRNKNKEDYSELEFPRIEDGVNGVRFVHAVIDSSKNGSRWVDL